MRLAYLTLLIYFSLLTGTSYSQVGVNNTTPNPSSVLDLVSTDKGVLVPRMTAAQRLAITSPATSLVVFDLTEGKFYFFTGSQWVTFNTFDQSSGTTTATHTGDVVINGKVTATSFEGINFNSAVPTGIIVMWSGTIATIPMGWKLCDGTNGTPDLRNRFVMGGGGTYNPNATGGSASNTVTIAENNLPLLKHQSSPPPAPNETRFTITGGDHTHTHEDDYLIENFADASSSFAPGTLYKNLGGNYRGIQYTDVNNYNIFYRNKSTTSTSHTHTFNVLNHGSTSPTPLPIPLPAFYALAYIMKQ